MIKTARKLFVFLTVAGLALTLNVAGINAAQLTSQSISLSNSAPATPSSYTIKFTTAGTASLNDVDFVFATTPSGAATTPSGMSLASATLTSTTNLGSGWTIDTSQAGSGILSITNATAQNIASATVATVVLGGLTNPAIGSGAAQCAKSDANGSSGTCYIRFTTKAAGPTTIDTGAASFTLVATTSATATLDPSMSMIISGVAAGQTNDGIVVSTGDSSTYNTLPFGHMAVNTIYDTAQEIQVYTNAQHGYTVTMAMTTPMTGSVGSNQISPFTANSATWLAPVAWTAPTGTTPNTNTAWIGGNTTDGTRVGGGVGGSQGGNQTFGPVNTTPVNVSLSNQPDNGTAVFVSYQLQANPYQPADTYTGVLQYNATPTY